MSPRQVGTPFLCRQVFHLTELKPGISNTEQGMMNAESCNVSNMLFHVASSGGNTFYVPSGVSLDGIKTWNIEHRTRNYER